MVYLGTRARRRGRDFVVEEHVTGFSYKALMRARSPGGGPLSGAAISYIIRLPLPSLCCCNKEFAAAKIQTRLKLLGLF